MDTFRDLMYRMMSIVNNNVLKIEISKTVDFRHSQHTQRVTM